MKLVSGMSSPFVLGFDEIERVLDQLTKSAGDGYPPYNIERLPETDGRGLVLRLTLAVAGFRDGDLDVTVEDDRLVIRGRQAETADRTYLHRGIAARQFQKTFVLADGIEVIGADLTDGLLSVDLSRPITRRAVRKIDISGRG